MFRTLKRVYAYNLRYKTSFFLGLFLLILHRIVVNGAAIFYKFLVDGIGKESFEHLVLLVLGLAFIQLLGIILHVLGYVVSDSYMFKAGRDLRVDVFTHLHKLDFSFHADKQSGSLISAMKRGDGAYFGLDHHLSRETLTIFVDFLFIIFALSYFDVSMVGVVIGSVALNALLMKFLVSKNIKHRTDFNNEDDNISHIIVDNMINYDTVKYFAKEEWERKRMLKQFIPWMSALWGYANTFRLIDIVTGLITLVGSALVMIIAFKKASNGEITVGDVTLILAFVTSFFPQLTNIVYRLREIAKNYIDVKKYLDILDNEITVVEKENAIELSNVQGKVDFENVRFNYNEREDVLKDINLNIEPGQSIAFVGESGAGKTTMTKLLLRFYDVKSGAIKLDGVDIREITKQSLRQNIGLVPQEPVLFNDTIGYNITYPKDNVSQEQLEEAVKVANLHTFIESLPKKYDTLVGERGIKLSGGQKQRLAIARAFIADPKIIIFDEATSQLDSKSEKLIQDSFWKLVENKTTIIIAHRLSTVMKADRIVVIDNGEISQQGTHQELIEHKGIYQSLWKLQSGDILE
ncbi:ABC transporter ATP-binding protein [Candidatus Dojkabacteria bacterium]|uniref:ABC transporter ATP-binding protein n=1 Tax=Candidatus Dojkabacteria bacterium TaxID=2099670 RepID=A0A955RIY1_9BACT|nr:ABC transporter ATP-binding protein [Candidatus Dojkabacteria bacterium]